MTDEDAKKQLQLDGPPVWANWRAAQKGTPALGAVEIPLYSDARITGEVSAGLGPYQFFNTVPLQQRHGIVRPAIVLRLTFHAEFETTISAKTDPGFYYGGSMADELAALAALFMGLRVRASGETRHFDPAGDPRGRPSDMRRRVEPTLSIDLYGLVLPGHVQERSMLPLTKLEKYPTLQSADAIRTCPRRTVVSRRHLDGRKRAKLVLGDDGLGG